METDHALSIFVDFLIEEKDYSVVAERLMILDGSRMHVRFFIHGNFIAHNHLIYIALLVKLLFDFREGIPAYLIVRPA